VRLFNELTPEQFRLYIGLRVEAQFSEACERRDSFGRPMRLEPGEVLFGIESCAVRYGISRDQVRRAVARFEGLGLVASRPGVAPATPPATAPGPGNATPSGRQAATPPTVLTFLTDREICWRTGRTTTAVTPAPAIAPAIRLGPAPAPIQHSNPESPNTERRPAGRARLGPLGARLVAEVATGVKSGLSPLNHQADAGELEAIIAERFGSVDDALALVATTCRERSHPGRPYVIRSQRLVLDILRDAVPPALRAEGSSP
jgi:hypothetical protein